MVSARRARCVRFVSRCGGAVDSTASLCSVLQTLRNDAVESTVCRFSGSQIARFARAMQTQTKGVRMVGVCDACDL
eukprot:11226380-Lingulodinium_polyedra.AAC.1